MKKNFTCPFCKQDLPGFSDEELQTLILETKNSPCGCGAEIRVVLGCDISQHQGEVEQDHPNADVVFEVIDDNVFNETQDRMSLLSWKVNNP